MWKGGRLLPEGAWVSRGMSLMGLLSHTFLWGSKSNNSCHLNMSLGGQQPCNSILQMMGQAEVRWVSQRPPASSAQNPHLAPGLCRALPGQTLTASA